MSVLSKSQSLVKVSFFTAFYPGDAAKTERHKTYIRALELHNVETILGAFRRKEKYCKVCGKNSIGYEEKETDVNIAVTLFKSAVLDIYDCAAILSNDSDLVPAIRAVKETFPAKTIRVLFPPASMASNSLKSAANSYMRLKEDHLKSNQFPDPLDVKGIVLRKPPGW